VAADVFGAVLTLAVRLIRRWVKDLGAAALRLLVMTIRVRNAHQHGAVALCAA
jgi:hypothetical protein